MPRFETVRKPCRGNVGNPFESQGVFPGIATPGKAGYRRDFATDSVEE